MSVTEVVLDKVLEATVVGSFSRIGYDVRSRLGHWDEPPSMKGRSVLITGATSGLGQATAIRLASLGATVRFVARDESRACLAHEAIVDASDSVDVGYFIADMADFDSVRAVAARLAHEFGVLDVLVHNAGALTSERAMAPDGTEFTVASQLLGPFLLTSLLLPLLDRSDPGRVVTVASGGMYSQRFDLSRLEMSAEEYDGTTAYARVSGLSSFSITNGPAEWIPPRSCSMLCTPGGRTPPESGRRCRGSIESCAPCCARRGKGPTPSCGSLPRPR